MSIADTVTRGYGSFGTIADVVRAGYSSGDSSIISDADAEKIAIYVWERILENGYQAQELMRFQSSILGGLLSKVGNQTPEFLSLDGTKVRVKYATDGVGNRVKRLEIDLT